MKELKRVILEGIIVLVAGAGVGLLANAVSPKGLSLTRIYFPTRSHADARTTTRPAAPDPTTSTPTHSVSQGVTDENAPKASTGTPGDEDEYTEQEQETVDYIKAQGLQAITHGDAVKLYNDPGRQLGDILFIDARNEQQFQEGHIPGAAHMDHYYIDNYIDEVLPLCQNALQIVVYCGGGDCEDSIFAAMELPPRGINPSKIHVYIGGMKEWKADGQPVETGYRNSGVFR